MPPAEYSNGSVRIALIHALRESIGPIALAFEHGWPEATLVNLLDDSLSADVATRGQLDDQISDRFLKLARYAAGLSVDAILFTCSAFGPCIERVERELAPLPVRKPNEAMIKQAVSCGGRIGLLATFAPTLATMPAEFPASANVVPIFVDRALEALAAGNGELHDQLIAEAAANAEIDVAILAQFSMARAVTTVRNRVGYPVITTPDAAVRELARAFGRAGYVS